jgi:hypothetical protein
MAAIEGSFLGLAKQSAKGTPNVTHGDFKYLLVREGAFGVNNITIPLDPEVGGGAFIRSVVKVGASNGGALDIIPRPESLGFLMYGVTGAVTSSSINANLNGVMGPVPLLVGAQAGYIDGIHQPEAAAALYCSCNNASRSFVVTVHGIVSGSATTETYTFPGAGYTANAKIAGGAAKVFTTITSVDFPAYEGATDKIQIGYDGSYYTHVFEPATDNFSAPYYTVRYAPANLWGEQYEDCRVNALTLGWRGARFVEGAAGLIGRKSSVPGTSSWNAATYVDSGPQFLSPYGVIELPTGTSARVLDGSFVATASIPMDQQFIVGSFFPEGVDITARAYILNLTLKIEDAALYQKIQYDPYGTANWTASVFKEADFKIYFRSDVGQYSFQIAGNGASGMTSPNVFWSATPIALRAQRQLTMNVTGVFTTAATGDVINMTLVNKRASY